MNSTIREGFAVQVSDPTDLDETVDVPSVRHLLRCGFDALTIILDILSLINFAVTDAVVLLYLYATEIDHTVLYSVGSNNETILSPLALAIMPYSRYLMEHSDFCVVVWLILVGYGLYLSVTSTIKVFRAIVSRFRRTY